MFFDNLACPFHNKVKTRNVYVKFAFSFFETEKTRIFNSGISDRGIDQ